MISGGIGMWEAPLAWDLSRGSGVDTRALGCISPQICRGHKKSTCCASTTSNIFPSIAQLHPGSPWQRRPAPSLAAHLNWLAPSGHVRSALHQQPPLLQVLRGDAMAGGRVDSKQSAAGSISSRRGGVITLWAASAPGPAAAGVRMHLAVRIMPGPHCTRILWARAAQHNSAQRSHPP